MKIRLPILLFSSLALLSCGTTPTSSSSSSSSSNEASGSSISSGSSKSSEASQSKEESSSSSKEESSPSVEPSSSVIESSEEPFSIEEPSSIVESSYEEESSDESSAIEESSPAESSEEVSAAWDLTSENIPETSAGKYNIEFDFSAGDASFHGSYLQRGSGEKNGISINGTIQVKADKDDTYGYFYLTSGTAYRLSFAVLRISSYYLGEDHDFTGVPTIYSADTMDGDNGEEVALTKTETTDALSRDVYLYEATLPHSSFRFENRSGYAIYLSSFSSISE